MSRPEPLSWCDLDPNRVWRAPTPRMEKEEKLEEEESRELNGNGGAEDRTSEDTSLMMRLTHNTSCISLSALEQQPSGSTATIFPPTSRPSRRPDPLEDQFLAEMQNVSIFSNNDSSFVNLRIAGALMNPWPQQQQSSSFGTASINGFTGSDTSSAPMSPISSPGLRKQMTGRNGYQQQPQQRMLNKSIAHHPNHFRNNNQGHLPQYGNHHLRAPVPQMVPSRTIQLRSGEEYQPGMRDLPYWLKKLRLHKYAPLFQDMSYRQLLQLDHAALERMRITNGARKKIAQSIDKLHERPRLLRSIEQKLKNGTQCVRCAICSVRQLLWSPFIKYDCGSRKTSAEILDGFNVPSQMISDDNLAALIYRVIETLNVMIFPLRKGLLDLEDEYQLTMFHMFDSIMKNESFTPNQQRRAFAMKKNARNYANPEEIRRHRMGMVSSSQCEGCHHAEVVNRERLMELADRQVRRARGDFVGEPTLSSCSAILDLTTPKHEARLEFNVPPVSPAPRVQKIQKRPAVVEDEEYLQSTGSPKMSSEAAVIDGFVLPPMHSKQYWVNVNEIWRDDSTNPSLPYPQYQNPANEEKAMAIKQEISDTSDLSDFNKPSFNFLRMLSEDQTPKTPSLSDFNFPESVGSSKKANSTGSGYSSSDSESSSPGASSIDDCSIPLNGGSVYGVNQVLCPSTFQFHPSAASYM